MILFIWYSQGQKYSDGWASQWLSGKESACSAGDTGSIPGSGRSPGGGHGNPLLYSCLENPMESEAWRASVHEVTKASNVTKHAIARAIILFLNV